jgi:hypothetical protein
MLLYSQDWSDCLTPKTSSDESFAIAILKLCVAYKINPYILDNAGRDVLEKLEELCRKESTAEGTREPLWDVKKALAQHSQPCWSKNARVRSWKALVPSGLQQYISPESGHYDEFGETPLHAFISHLDPRKEKANEVQKKLGGLLHSFEGDFDALYMRNKVGLTPLHLAIRLSLPHVVGMLLLAVGSRGLWRGPNKAARIKRRQGFWGAVREALSVESYDGTMLLQDVHETYWAARDSTDEYAFHVEVDALICLCLVTNAMAGKLPKEGHVYRTLRVAQEWPHDKKAEKRPCDNIASDEDGDCGPRNKKTAYSPRWDNGGRVHGSRTRLNLLQRIHVRLRLLASTRRADRDGHPNGSPRIALHCSAASSRAIRSRTISMHFISRTLLLKRRRIICIHK